MTDRDPSFAVVLSGGGARGAFEAGVVRALDDAGLRPGIVSGTSAGALTGAGIACGWSGDRMARLWSSLQTRDVMRVRTDVHRLVRPSVLLRDPRVLLGAGRGTTSDVLLDALGWTWFLHLGPMRRLLVDELGGERLPIDDDVTLTLSAVEADTGRLVRFSNRPVPDEERDSSTTIVTELTVDHVLASSSIPGLFEPIEVDGRSYWDGGLTSNTPLTGALEHDPDRVLVVGATKEAGPGRVPRSLGDVIAFAIGHVFRDALLRDVDNAMTVNRLASRVPEATSHRVVELATVMPDEPIRGLGDLLDFEPAVAADLIEAGRRRAAAVLDERGWNRG